MKNNLEEIWKNHNIRQEELEKALKVSRQTIGSLENGRYNPSILLAFKISLFISVDVEDIFIYEEKEKDVWIRKNEIINFMFWNYCYSYRLNIFNNQSRLWWSINYFTIYTNRCRLYCIWWRWWRFNS